MLTSLGRFDAFLWIAIAIAQLLVSLVLLRRRLERRYPAFSLYVYYSAITTLLLMVIPASARWLIFWSYYAIAAIACVLMAMAVGELYQKVFGRKWARVPAWVPRNVATWLAIAISSCAVLALALKPVGWHKYMVYMNGLEESLVTAILISLIILMFYSRHLGFTMRPWPHRIAIGFIFMLSVNSTTLYMLGLTPRGTAEAMRRLGMISYLVSLAWWGCTLWGQATVPEEATIEQAGQMIGMHRHTLEATPRIVQILGQSNSIN